MSDFPSYRPPPAEPRFIKARMLVAYFWPLAIVFVIGFGALTVVAFPELYNRDTPVLDEETAQRTVATTRPNGEPEPSIVSMGNTSLWVDSDPVGAGVLVDGDSVGTTPVLVPVIEYGQHAVTVRAPGYEPSETFMLIDDDTPAELWITLEPK